MQQLHLVGYTTDHEGLIFSARKGSKSGSYIVPLDDRLRDVIDEADRLRDGQPDDSDTTDGSGSPAGAARRKAARVESTLSPREMQSRLRAGRSIAQVAAEAGVDEDWVARFAVPIMAEQAQVVQRARNLTSSKPRLGPSSQPLGVSVWWNLAEKGLRLPDDLFDAGWSAIHVRDSAWIVRYSYSFRKKNHVAEWEVDLRSAELHPRNRTASDLGYIEPGRRRRPAPVLPSAPPSRPAPPAEEVSKAAERPAGARSGAKGAGTKKAAAKKRAAKKPARRSAPAAKKQTVGRSTAGRSSKAAGRSTKKTAAKKTPAKRPAAKRAPAKKSVPARKSGSAKKRGGAGKTPAKKRQAAKKAPARKAPARKAVATSAPAKKRAATKKAPAKKRPAPAKAPAKRATAKRPPAAKTRAPARKQSAVDKTAGKRAAVEKQAAAVRRAAPPAATAGVQGSAAEPGRSAAPRPVRSGVVERRAGGGPGAGDPRPADRRPAVSPSPAPAAVGNGAGNIAGGAPPRPITRVDIPAPSAATAGSEAASPRPVAGGPPDTGGVVAINSAPSAAPMPRPTILAPRASEPGAGGVLPPDRNPVRSGGLRARLRGRRSRNP